MRWRARLATAAAAGMLAALPGPASADCINAPFEDQVRQAAVIFVGTLDRIDVEHSTEFAGSVSRIGGCAAILMAFRRTSLLFFAGHTSTHSSQPVQSSGATCTVYFMPLYSGPL